MIHVSRPAKEIVAVKRTAICIIDGEGRVVRERVLVKEPESLAAYLRGTGLAVRTGGP